MATLIVNSDNLPILSRKIVLMLQKRSFGIEDICNRTQFPSSSVRKELSLLRAFGIVDHDGCRPRTWKLKEPEAA